jgi:hypothetical protein
MEALDRPTLREWKRQQTRIRYQQRLDRTIPRYRLKLLALLINALGLLILAILATGGRP